MNNCSCVSLLGALNRGGFSSAKFIKSARKEHVCGECLALIPIGEPYERARCLYDGNWDTYDTCMDCKSIIAAFFCNGYYYTSVLDDLGNHIMRLDGNISSDCLMALTPAARDRVCDMIEECWEKIPGPIMAEMARPMWDEDKGPSFV